MSCIVQFWPLCSPGIGSLLTSAASLFVRDYEASLRRAYQFPPCDAQMSTRILIVDDYSVARKTVRSLLVWHSLEVCGEAENGKQAIEKVRQLKPDLVLLDINMPVMNGVQAA